MDYPPAFSPASSTTSSSMSLHSDRPSPTPSPASSSASEECYDNNYERMSRLARRSYRDCYEERLNRPLAPFRSLDEDVAHHRNMPKATHKPEYDSKLQMAFEAAVASNDGQALHVMLSANSEAIDVNKYDSQGRTPLQKFCGVGQLSLAKLLIQYGADSNMRTREGWSLIHIASFSGSSDMVNFVLKHNRGNRPNNHRGHSANHQHQ